MKAIFAAFVLFPWAVCAAGEIPKQLRVSLQLIEVPHPVLTELLAGTDQSGPALHSKAWGFCKDGRGKLLDTCIVLCPSGQKAVVESRREEIYPTDYDSGCELGWREEAQIAPVSLSLRPDFKTAFETRNTGVSFEVEPTLDEGDELIDLRMAAEVVSLLRLDTWMKHVDEWGDASTRLPVFETWRSNSSVVVAAGKFEMVTVLSPKPKAPVPAVMSKILVFVRADVVSLASKP